jgi:hypothetical protein
VTGKEKAERAPGKPQIFASGICFLALAAFQIKTSGHNTLTTIYLVIGFYIMWREGYNKDSSHWKVKPTPIIVLFFAFWAALIYGTISREQARKRVPKKKEVPYIEQLALKQNQPLPCLFTGADSLMHVKVLNENTLEYIYKVNVNATEIDSKFKEQFREKTTVHLRRKLAGLNPRVINKYRENHLLFCHRFLDLRGEAMVTINIDPDQY